MSRKIFKLPSFGCIKKLGSFYDIHLKKKKIETRKKPEGSFDYFPVTGYSGGSEGFLPRGIFFGARSLVALVKK